MKVVLRGSSLPLTLLGILSNAGVSKVETTLRRGVAGRLRIGMNLEAIKTEFDPGVVEIAGTLSVEIYFGEDRGKLPDLIAGFYRDSVFQIRVNSRKFKTALGVGVGSAAIDLKRLYRAMWQTPAVAYVDALGMGFELQDGKIISILIS